MQWKNKEMIRVTFRLPKNVYDDLKKINEESEMPVSLNDFLIIILIKYLNGWK